MKILNKIEKYEFVITITKSMTLHSHFYYEGGIQVLCNDNKLGIFWG